MKEKLMKRIEGLMAFRRSYPYPNDGVSRIELGDGFYLRSGYACTLCHIDHDKDLADFDGKDKDDIQNALKRKANELENKFLGEL